MTKHKTIHPKTPAEKPPKEKAKPQAEDAASTLAEPAARAEPQAEEDSLARLREELEAVRDRELRCRAELDNYRKRAARLAAAGADPQQIRQLGRIAQKRCLANIRDLIQYAETIKFTDTEATRQLMLRELRAQEARWRDDATWDELMDLGALSNSIDTDNQPEV